MLFGKINPTAKVPSMTDPFTYTVAEATHIAATAERYNLGAKQVFFNVFYGTPTLDEAGVMTAFQTLLTTSVTLDEADIADWGTDDSVVLAKIAAKIGTTITETVEGFPDNFRSI